MLAYGVLLRLVEDHHAVFPAGTPGPLFFGRQVFLFPAVFTTAAVIFCGTLIALYEKQVAAIVFANLLKMAKQV